jgi:hypothetical protein
MVSEPVRQTPIRRDEVTRAVSAVRAKGEHRAELAALAYDLLSRQAEGRALYAGKEHVEKRAEEHGVTRDSAQTEAGNVYAILERGAESALERALVCAFAISGLGDALGDEPGDRVFRFVRHADWLEVCTDYTVWPFVDELLDEEKRARVWEELAQLIVDEAAGRDADRPRARGYNAARMSALAASSSPSARESLRRVVRSSAIDEPTRLLASTLAGDGVEEARSVHPRVHGLLGRAPRRSPLETLRWISGFAAASWLVRAIAFLLGVRRQAELRLSDSGLEVHTRVSLLGRTVRENSETWRLEALDGAGRQVRYPALHLLVGACALSFGILFGGLVLFDGVRSGELVLLLIAAVLVLAGAGLDLALDVLVPARRGKVVLDLSARSRRPLRLTRVPVEEADAFLRALRNRVGAS